MAAEKAAVMAAEEVVGPIEWPTPEECSAPTEGPLWQQVRQSLAAWRSIGANSHVLGWINHGVTVPWSADGPPSQFYGHQTELTTEQKQYWHAVLKPHYLSNGAVIRIPKHHAHHVSPAFFVEKAGTTPKEFRLIVNLKHVNKHCTAPKFRLDTVSDLARGTPQNAFFIKWDLRDAYHHFRLHPSDQQFFQFCIDGEYFQCVALPFGWNGSPFFFQKIIRVFTQAIRSHGVIPTATIPHNTTLTPMQSARQLRFLLNYLDDFVASTASFRAGKRLGTEARVLMRRLGLAWKEAKCMWRPAQQVEALGLHVDSTTGTFTLTTRRKQSILGSANEVLQMANAKCRRVPKKRLAMFIGRAVSSIMAIPYCQFKLQQLQLCLHSHPSWAASTMVKLTNAAMRELRWWCTPSHLSISKPWLPPVCQGTLTTDSSDFGWGAVLEMASGVAEAQGSWPPAIRAQHITLKELQAVRMALTSFTHMVQGKHIRLRSDATVVVEALVHFTSRSRAIRQELVKLHHVLTTNAISLTTEHLPGVLNQAADALSRLQDREDWMLARPLFRQVQRHWGRCFTTDRFASHLNHQCKRFWSRYHCPGSSGVDSLNAPAADWQEHYNWCNPPWSLLPETVHKFMSLPNAHGVVVTPWWPNRPWFACLMQRCNRYMVLPATSGMFWSKGTEPAPPPAWDVAVFEV